MITGGQIRAARAYARVSAAELASLAGIARMTVVKAEAADGVPHVTATNLRSIQDALEKLGAIFGPDGEVNLKPPSAKSP
jgi:predicted transcriptional regulator